jgi:hypothetical protein
MGFSGGGSNILKSHTHDGTIVQDGGSLNMDNVTQGALTAGDIVYSDGSHLQRLAIGAVNTTLSSTGAVPQWAGAAGASAELVGTTRITTPASHMTVTFASISGSDISNLDVYWTGLATAGSPYAAEKITINGLTGNVYKTQWLEQRSGAGSFSQDTNTEILQPSSARLHSGQMTLICGTAEQDAAGLDTVYQYLGQISGAAPNYATWQFGGTYDDPGVTVATTFTEVKIELDTGNWNTGAQMSVFRNNVT